MKETLSVDICIAVESEDGGLSCYNWIDGISIPCANEHEARELYSKLLLSASKTPVNKTN